MLPPYYIVPDVERYRELDPKSDEAKSLCRKIAANIGDYASLRLVLGIDPPEFACFYPDMEPASPDTSDTINSFLEKYGQSLPLPDVLAQLEQSPEVAEEVMEDGAEETERPLEKENKEENQEPSDLSDVEKVSLGVLLSKQKYKEALALIERQNLINPHKSIYFAHQMRFLRKLMAIQKYKNQTRH